MTDDYYIRHRRARRHPAGPKYRAVLHLMPWGRRSHREVHTTHIKAVFWMWRGSGRE